MPWRRRPSMPANTASSKSPWPHFSLTERRLLETGIGTRGVRRPEGQGRSRLLQYRLLRPSPLHYGDRDYGGAPERRRADPPPFHPREVGLPRGKTGATPKEKPGRLPIFPKEKRELYRLFRALGRTLSRFFLTACIHYMRILKK